MKNVIILAVLAILAYFGYSAYKKANTAPQASSTSSSALGSSLLQMVGNLFSGGGGSSAQVVDSTQASGQTFGTSDTGSTLMNLAETAMLF